MCRSSVSPMSSLIRAGTVARFGVSSTTKYVKHNPGLFAWNTTDIFLVCPREQKSVIEVPKQCKPNEQLDPSGRCRPVWRLFDAGANEKVVRQSEAFIECLMLRVFDRSLECRKGAVNGDGVPHWCPSGQQAVASGRCRIIYNRYTLVFKYLRTL